MSQQESQHQQHHHHHHHHRPDSASRFRDRNLRAIRRNKLIEKYLKIGLTVLAVLMVCAVVFVYAFG